MERIWSFDTARFSVVLECEDERDPDTSWADDETLANLESGCWVNACFAVRVFMDGVEVASSYLGNSIYAEVADFRREHITYAVDVRAARERGVSMGSYFPEMVREAIAEARKTLCNAPRMRCA